MKNLYLIPTDKPSRLLKTMPKGNLILSKSITSGSHWENQNIYMTSDEEIKYGDWVIKISLLYKGGGSIQKYSFIDRQFEDITFKKIILTTDPKLIEDGVQAIDDDFLEWFVRNPSCEWVKVRKNPKVHFIVKGKGVKGFNQGYKIIIPKEEPKQETLEEVAEKYAKQFDYAEDSSPYIDFIEGAKWQQEQMYSEEDLLGAFEAGMMFIGEDKGSFDEWFKQFKKK